MKKLQTTMLMILCLVILPWRAEAVPSRMTNESIRGVISEMLSQHIERHNLDGYSLHSALIHYFETADPEHLYLMKDEVAPFLSLSTTQREELARQYAQGDFSLYRELNGVIQEGMRRSFAIRSYNDAENAALFEEAHRRYKVGAQQSGYEEGWADYASTQEELMQRHRLHFLNYVGAMMHRFGVDEVMNNQAVVIERYQRQMRFDERPYLYQDADGQILSDTEQDHLFSTNVVKALAVTLDAHSSFFDDSEAFDMKLRLEKGFVGIGVVVKEVLAGYQVAEILSDSPAEQSTAVQVDDLLIAVNGQSLAGMSFEEVMKLVRGVEGQAVQLVLATLDKNSPSQMQQRTVNLMPRLIILKDDRVETSYESFHDGIIGRIKLDSFYEGPQGISSVQDVIDGIRDLSQQGELNGLILDLRENSGGYLTQAVKVAGLFITNGVVAMSKYSDGEKHYYRDLDGKAYYDGPLVVLTSKLTASAAEIVAQALQDYGVALVVGDEQTYGKGTIQAQTVTEGENSQYFKVTVGKYYTVSGMTPQLRGVKADVVLPGEYSSLDIGEGHLESALSSDQVRDAFDDALWDVEPRARAWYTRYYLPTLQPREDDWKSMLPLLRERSGARLDTNKEYQLYLKNSGEDSRWKFTWSEEDVSLQNFNVTAFQISEATNILKDMIKLESQMVHNDVVKGSEKADPLYFIGVERSERDK